MKHKRKLSFLLMIFALSSLIFFSACRTVDIIEGAYRVKRYQDAKNITFSEADGFYIGRKILANFFIRRRPLFDRKLTKYVNAVGQTLAAVSQRPDIWAGYRFIVFRSPSISAYSMPGGFILISTGTLQLCDNEDQLAAVLGHELGHARWRHALEALKDTIVKRRRAELTAFVASRSGSALIQIFAVAAIINWEKQMNSYSRTQELEADVYSCWLMMKAGYNPLAMIRILKKIPKGRSYYCRLHPTVRERLSVVRKEIARYRKIPFSSKKRTLRYKSEVLDYLRDKSMDNMDYEGRNKRGNDDDNNSMNDRDDDSDRE